MTLDALRAEIWRVASDDQLVEEPLLERVLGVLGAGLGACRAALYELDGEQLCCRREWRAAGRAPGAGTALPAQALNRLLAGGATPAPLEAPPLAEPYLLSGGIAGAFALVRADDAPVWEGPERELLREVAGVVAQAVARRRRESAARQVELRNRIVAELADDAAFSWAFPAEGAPALEWSTAGRPPLPGLGRGEPFTPAALLERVHLADRPRVEEALRAALRNTASAEAFRVRAGDGEERWLQLRLRPIWDAAGARVARVFGLVRDVSDRYRAEEALRRERDLVRAILEASPDGIVVSSLADVVVDCNAAAWRVAGCASREELLGRSVFSLVGERDLDEARAVQARVRAGEPVRGLRWAGRGADGHEFPMELSLGLVRAPGGEPWGFVAVIKNLTDRLEFDARMLRAQKAESLEVLAAGVAHDYNNLLAAIAGNASLALAGLPADSPAREDVTEIARAAERAAELNRQLLAYAGKGSLVIAPVDLSQLITEMGRLLESSIAKKCALQLDLPRALPRVEADARALQQAAFNLVVNAAEAIGDSAGSIVLRTGARRCDRDYLASSALGLDLPEGEYAFIEVSDDGCGMDGGTLGRIFDPFFTTKFTGRGLGLAAVAGIARAHRGTVRVESEPGRGTTFRLLLPARRQVALPPSVSATAVIPGGTVLLAEDEEVVRRTARVMLEREGYRVEAAVDGREALDRLGRDPACFRLAILDMNMPALDGAEVLRELRGVRPDLPVLISSGIPEAEAVGRDDPLVAFLQKPFTRLELLAAVERVLALAAVGPPARSA